MLLSLATAVNANANAQAEASSDSGASQAVEVHGVKDPALMPYRKAYDLITGVDRVAGRRVQLVIRLTSSKSDVPVPDLDVRLVGENTHAKVPVSPDGFVDLPLDRGAYDDAADIVANQADKSLQVGIFVVPRFEPGEIRYADVVQTVSAARAAVAQILPWYLRLLLPGLHGVGLCYPAAGQAVGIKGGESALRAATVEDKDMAGGTVYCARFSAAEAGLREDGVLVPPDGWVALFW